MVWVSILQRACTMGHCEASCRFNAAEKASLLSLPARAADTTDAGLDPVAIESRFGVSRTAVREALRGRAGSAQRAKAEGGIG